MTHETAKPATPSGTPKVCTSQSMCGTSLPRDAAEMNPATRTTRKRGKGLSV
jgi:hypothetical protein